MAVDSYGRLYVEYQRLPEQTTPVKKEGVGGRLVEAGCWALALASITLTLYF
jgi:hypothetical protein